MDRDEQIDAFSAEIANQIGYFRQEFKLPMEALVGVLETAKHDLITSCEIYFESDIEDMEIDNDDDPND
tara:strand:+ start:25999 stop:26205 length:207 start_codon:yes stop_codon:yes gene_type:complete